MFLPLPTLHRKLVIRPKHHDSFLYLTVSRLVTEHLLSRLFWENAKGLQLSNACHVTRLRNACMAIIIPARLIYLHATQLCRACVCSSALPYCPPAVTQMPPRSASSAATSYVSIAMLIISESSARAFIPPESDLVEGRRNQLRRLSK